MPNTSYFCIKRDLETAKNGGFWCNACIIGKPQTEASPDPRYCHGCYEVLSEEARIDKSWRKADWKPSVSANATSLVTSETGGRKDAIGAGGHTGILSTLKGDKNTVDKIRPRETNRGRKRIDLPESIIFSLADESMGSKAIATRLKEQGIFANYRTIARVLERRVNHAQG